MAKPVRLQRDTAALITQAAIDLFREQGYRATTLREIADRVGVQVGSLYNYIASKEQLLFDIMRHVMVDLCEGAEAAIDGVADPLEQIQRFMHHSIRFHGEHRKEVFIGNYELRSLSPRRLQAIVELRDRYEELLWGCLQRAVDAGQVVVPDVRLATYAGLAICSQVAAWYRPDGPRSLDEIAESLCAIYSPLAPEVNAQQVG